MTFPQLARVVALKAHTYGLEDCATRQGSTNLAGTSHVGGHRTNSHRLHQPGLGVSLFAGDVTSVAKDNSLMRYT